MNFIKIKNYFRIKILKLLYINIFNKNYNYKLYFYKIIKIINKIYKNFYKKESNIKYYFWLIKKINKINNTYYFQYEEKELIKYIFFLTFLKKKKINIIKNDNIKLLFYLYKITKKTKKKILKIINKYIRNWDINRINYIDIIIIRMAICEYFYINKCQNLKIIIYEYINISKIFSTIKSKSFINGILDNIFKNVKLIYVK